jgi:hypothetical protein
VVSAGFASRRRAKAVVELSGPDGGPVHVESGDRERALANRLRQFIAEHTGDQQAIERNRRAGALAEQLGVAALVYGTLVIAGNDEVGITGDVDPKVVTSSAIGRRRQSPQCVGQGRRAGLTQTR